jgi:hypothetical protein
MGYSVTVVFKIMLLIHCPSCHGALEVNSTQLTRPRRICCALCNHRFVAEPAQARKALPSPPKAEEPALPPISDQAIPSPAEPAPQAAHFSRKKPPPQAAPRQPQRRSHAALAAAGLVAIVTLMLAGRETIVRQWPPAAQAFAVLGLPVNLNGLDIRDMRTRIVQEPTQRVLTIDGQIRNLRDHSQALPELLLSLRDSAGREVYAWKAPPPKSGLTRGETIQFRARLASPPEGAQSVRVQFAEPAATRLATR